MKILLGTSNTKWGVIVKPQSSNVYRNILSFDTPQLKDDFLNTEVFQKPDGSKGDYKTELRNSNNRAVMEIDSLTIEFRVNETEYPYETFDSLLNKDFCAMEDEHGKIKFYAITDAQRKGNIIEYTAELDIFFTHDIKDIFNDRDTQINRGMVDRFYKDNGQIKNIHLKPDQDYKSPLYANDDYENGMSSTLIPDEQIPLDYDYSTCDVEYDIKDYSGDLDALKTKLKNNINSIMNCISWEVIYIKQDGTYNAASFVNHNNFYSNLKKRGFFKTFPEINEYLDYGYADEIPHFRAGISLRLNFDDENDPLITDASLYNYSDSAPMKLLEDANVVKNSRHITSIPPYIGITGNSNLKIRISISFIRGKSDITDFNVHIIPSGGFHDADEFNHTKNEKGSWNLTTPKLYFNPMTSALQIGYYGDRIYFNNFMFNRNVSDSYVKDRKDYLISNKKPFNDSSYNLSINDKVSNVHPNEIKADFFPFRKFRLKNWSTNFMDIAPQNITKNVFEFISGFGYLPDSWLQYAIPKHYKNIYQNGADIAGNENEYFADITSYSLLTSQNAYEEYIIRNKSQMQTGINSITQQRDLGIAGAVIGGIGGLVSKNPLATIGAVFGGVSQSLKSEMELNKIKALKQDLHNTPNTIVNAGTTLALDLQLKLGQTNITSYKLEPLLNVMVREHIYKYGYNFKGKIAKINDVINNRYYFNYIEASETFENVKLQLSAKTKQIINDSLEQGITIWNVRDLNTFKGIKNYEYENVEMSMIGNP